MRWRTISALLLVPVLAMPAAAGASTDTSASPSLDRGYHSMYNLQFAAAQQEFSGWQKQHPDDPLGPVSEAAGLLFSELNRLGVLETRLFQDDSRFEKRKKLTPDSDLRMRFNAALQRAEAYARVALSRNANDENALFALALAAGLRADYTALVEKRNMASLRHTKEASSFAKKLLGIAPQYYDAYLATGVSKYIVGSLVAPVRWFVRLAGYEGDKDAGMKELQLAADRGRYLAPFARILLCVAYLRDQKKEQARQLLAGLRSDFPNNDLFARELARLQSTAGGQ
jgi:hypothetical protein